MSFYDSYSSLRFLTFKRLKLVVNILWDKEEIHSIKFWFLHLNNKCCNLPFGGRATRDSRVRVPRKEYARSRHQRLFEENFGKGIKSVNKLLCLENNKVGQPWHFPTPLHSIIPTQERRISCVVGLECFRTTRVKPAKILKIIRNERPTSSWYRRICSPRLTKSANDHKVSSPAT